ncbi:MAG TPA: hypothetical protein DCE28_06105 [Halomonas sp.]|nr:hypothetical protein [Halomonas sp.]
MATYRQQKAICLKKRMSNAKWKEYAKWKKDAKWKEYLLKSQTHRAPPKRGPIIESKRFEYLNNR